MRFLGALKSRLSVENVAKTFVKKLLKKYYEENALCLQMAVDFVNDCLLAIGLDCCVTVDQLEKSLPYQWPKDQLNTYYFQCEDKKLFERFEKFLTSMCGCFADEHEQFRSNVSNLESIDDSETPIMLLEEVLAIWCNAFKNLQEEEQDKVDKFLEEPMARINYHLLMSCYELSKKCTEEMQTISKICRILYKSVLNGLKYRETYMLILNGFLNIFERDFENFHQYCNMSINFFYEAFSYLHSTYKYVSNLKIYESLSKLLNNKNNNTAGMKILLKYLFEPKMWEVYFTTLTNTKKNISSRKVIEQALKFLKLLQSKMGDVNRFDVSFVEAILDLCTQSNIVMGNAAADLYITIMRRVSKDEIILTHMLLFYAQHVDSTTKQYSFIRNLHKYFDYLQSYDNIYNIIYNNNSNEMLRLAGAQCLLTVVMLNTKNQDNVYDDAELQRLLLSLPDRFVCLNCQNTIAILLRIFGIFPTNQWRRDVVANFKHYAYGVFRKFNNNYQYVVLMNIGCLFLECLHCDKEWNYLENVAEYVMEEFIKNKSHLKQPVSAQPDIFYGILKRLNILLKINFQLYDNIDEILSVVAEQYMQQRPAIEHMQSFMDLYALEIMCSCILKLAKSGLEYDMIIAEQQGTALASFVWQYLKNVDNLLKMPVMHIKTYFNIMVLILDALPLLMEVRIYQTLLEILIALNFTQHSYNEKDGDESLQLHPAQSVQYQRLMLRSFTQLHNIQQVAINTKVIWKLCIYYKLGKHHFNNELKLLLITLAKDRFDLFKHILPVLIFNLYKYVPKLNLGTIKFIITQHKNLIFSNCEIDEPEILCSHIVLTLLQILEKTLQLPLRNNPGNRLEPLHHLYVFLNEIDFKMYAVKPLIVQQLQQIGDSLLNTEERQLYEEFQKTLNNS